MAPKPNDLKAVDARRNATLHSRVYPDNDGDSVVISGMSGKFPNCDNIEEFEYSLYNKIDMVDEKETRWRHFSPEIPRRAGKLPNICRFDATFFGVHFKQAITMDPQTRMLMEVAYECVIDAGINPKSLRGTKTGVYIGACISEAEKTWFYEKVATSGFGITGCSRAMLANRISYSLGLNGPSFLIDTACSSSMYALDNAFTALRNGEIDAAIVGGSNLTLHPFVTLQFARLGVLAADGFCRPFDSKASGYTRSEAISCVFLQRKRDALRIYAELVYSKTNCDGYKPEGITYPSGALQEKLLNEFYEDIHITPDELGYLEAHSTGTVVGDPEECRAVDVTLCSKRTSPLPVGSVKSNIGHTEPASGVCSIVKVCLTFQNELIPPNINFDTARSDIPCLIDGRLDVIREPRALEKPYVAMNSFGFGGANAHALFQAMGKEKVNNGVPQDNFPRLVIWAGRTQEAVDVVLNKVERSHLDAEFVAMLNNIQLEDVPGMVFRGYGIFGKGAEDSSANSVCLGRNVNHYTGVKRPLVWLCSGMGSQWPAMGKSMMTIPLFRQTIEECHEYLKPHGLNLIEIMTSNDPHMFDNIIHSFVGIAATQIALADVLRALKLEPDYIIGHSTGEVGCAYADGTLNREQAILAAYYRGRVSVDCDKIFGSMAAVGLGFKKIFSMLPDSIEVACHNSADSCTISGPAADVAKFVAELKSQGIFAKEVACSNIAYHSRYISQMGEPLLNYLKPIIPKPKERSSKWYSTSLPKSEWDAPGRNLCSAEYLANNMCSSVLFEETFDLLPKNALTIELAPHGLLQAILKRSMTEGVHIPLTQRGNENNATFFMGALGKLFQNGFNFPVNELYPNVEFPVSRGTPGISSLVKWDHGEEWFVTRYENMKTKCSGEREFKIHLVNTEEEYVLGHVIDGKILMPATSYLYYVWQTFSLMYHGPSYIDVPVEFIDVRFLRATNMSRNGDVVLTVMIHYGSGYFEITEGGAIVVSGRIVEIEKPEIPEIPEQVRTDCPVLTTKDFYKELKLRGYHYTGQFRAVREARTDNLGGKIEFKFNWPTFMDAMLQMHILAIDSRTLMLPTRIGKLRINGNHHMKEVCAQDQTDVLLDVYMDHENNRIVAGGVEIFDLEASAVQRRKSPGIPVLERYQFVPHFPAPSLSVADAVRVAVQLSLENSPALKLKVVEVQSDEHKEPIIAKFIDAVEDLPLITGDYTLLTQSPPAEPIDTVNVENAKLATQMNAHFIVLDGLFGEMNEFTISVAQKSLVKDGYVIVRESTRALENLVDFRVPQNYRLIAVVPLLSQAETLLILQVSQAAEEAEERCVIKITDQDTEFEWIDKVNAALAKQLPTVVYAFNEKRSGLLGLVNCLRKEPDGNLITAFFIDDPNAPAFDLTHPFYEVQLGRGLAINVFRNGQWGTYRHLLLTNEPVVECRSDQVYAHIIHRGDLSSIRWLMSPLAKQDCNVRVVCSSLNFRDIVTATGRINPDATNGNRLDTEYSFGFEYAGVDTRTGKRMMCVVMKTAVCSYHNNHKAVILEVPDEWTLMEAATVPVVYFTVYYAFFFTVDIRKGKSILIHSGTGGVGLAAIRTALAYNLEVFTTCGTPQKKKYLLDMFPQLKESHIGNSRDTSFEKMIRRETKGKGVDFVLNSLAEDKLQASIRCLATHGHFLEIGKFDMMNDSPIGMKHFLKEISFHGILADRLVAANDGRSEQITKLIYEDIAKGIVKPLPNTVFPPHEIEQAFRYMASGKHIGKVTIQIREDENSPVTLPMKVWNQVYFNPQLSYIIPGGLGGFGLELADWMVLRGAKKIVLSSRRGISKAYQAYRINLWKTYDVVTVVSTADITTKSGCLTLFKEAESLGPIGGIFNLAVALHDGIFQNQTKEMFMASFAPKALATKHLDELSRALCPNLEHFVIFSSVSCGRGNAGQTNYGMANSIMERIIESRVEAGYPGKAIQWGAVGEVGLVADMAEDKIDMEIGGTLQQRITSCLQELDTLLFAPDPLVASMVVAEKRTGSGNENIIETVMNIMGIRDLKSVSLGTTLSEIGMDSLMAVEIKQRLERDFELVLTPQDLRSLTFQKLQEYNDARKLDSSEGVVTLGAKDQNAGMEILMRNLGDESRCHEIIIPLETAAIDKTSAPVVIIPGLEGTITNPWIKIGKNLKSHALMLQLHEFAAITSVKGVAEASFEHVKMHFQGTQPFYIVGYSYGCAVAIELASLLEQAGYSGQVLLIDGSPHFLQKLACSQLNDEEISDENLYNMLLINIVCTIYPQESYEHVASIFLKAQTIDEKLDCFMEYVDKQSIYSREYSRTVVQAMFRRIRMIVNLDLKSVAQLKSPITLVRPGEVSLQDMEDDYCLSQVTKNSVTLKVIEGNHSSMLDNPVLAQLINTYHPTVADNKSMTSFLRECEQANIR